MPEQPHNDQNDEPTQALSQSDLLDFLDGLGSNNTAKWTLSVKPWGVYLDKSCSHGFDTATDCLRDAFLKSNAED